MSDGVAAVLARMQQLDGQLRSVDPNWIGSTPGAFGATADWVSSATFGQALAAAGAAQGTPGLAPSETTGPGSAIPAAPTATAGTAGMPLEAAGGTAPSDTAAAAGAGAPIWALAPSAVARARGEVAAASQSLASDIVAGTGAGGAIVGGVAGGAVAAGSGIGGGVPFSLPIAGARISQAFGPSSVALEPSATVDGVRYAHFHVGIDYAAPEGTPVTAAADGVVALAGRVADGAVDVVIKHASGVETLYGHLQPGLRVHAGQRVRAGQVLGKVGMTGNTTGPHLHFALSRGGVPLDPAPLLERGVLPGIGKGGAGTDGAGSAAGAGGPDLAAFDGVADEIPFAKDIRAAAVEAGIDPLLLASMVKFESGFRPRAVSYLGAMGLCQLMPATARALGVTNPFDPVQNLRGGARYLASNLKLYGRADLALAAYQAGRGSVDRAGGLPSSPTTRHYVTGIIKRWSYWLRKGSA